MAEREAAERGEAASPGKGAAVEIVEKPQEVKEAPPAIEVNDNGESLRLMSGEE